MRRRYLWLLAVFMPTVLGFAALSYLFLAPDSETEAAATSPIVRQEPLVEDTISDETVIAPIETDALSPSAPRDDDAREAAPQPESPQRPAHLESESSDIIGPPLLASSTAKDASSDAPEPALSRGSVRLASLSAAGGGGAPNTSGSSKTSSDSATNPVDVSDSGNDSSTPGGSGGTGGSPGGDTDPNGGKGEGSGGESGDGNGGHEGTDEEDPPISDSDPDDDTSAYDPIPDEHELPVVQVPEPAGIGLMLLGLLGCAAGRRRKN